MRHVILNETGNHVVVFIACLQKKSIRLIFVVNKFSGFDIDIENVFENALKIFPKIKPFYIVVNVAVENEKVRIVRLLNHALIPARLVLGINKAQRKGRL